MLYPIFKKFVFNMDPETVHDLSIKYFNKFPTHAALFNRSNFDKKYHLSDGHMSWSFPVGMAAGFDKNAMAIDFLQNLGFGAVEIGTITPKAQIGNEKPRITRYAKQNSVLNSMGFPNLGQDRIYQNLNSLKKHDHSLVGSNLGKNKDTTPQDTPLDYAMLYEKFAPLSDYLVINISSPNTPGLRALQSRDGFKAICEALHEKRKTHFRPLYLKIAPELHQDDLIDLIELCKEFKFSGVIATNTSVDHNFGKGGLSGDIIKNESAQCRKMVLECLKETPELSVIGVGGISSISEVIDFWKLGGSFVQIYTSFIFKGPRILTEFRQGIDSLLKNSDYDNLQDWHNQFKRSI